MTSILTHQSCTSQFVPYVNHYISDVDNSNRCISNWFDEEGTLVMSKYSQDVFELYNKIRNKKD